MNDDVFVTLGLSKSEFVQLICTHVSRNEEYMKMFEADGLTLFGWTWFKKALMQLSFDDLVCLYFSLCNEEQP